MEGNTGVGANAFLTSTKSPEIFNGFRNDVFVKLNHHSSFKLSTKANVQIASRIRHFLLNSKNVSMEKKKKRKPFEFLKEQFMLQYAVDSMRFSCFCQYLWTGRVWRIILDTYGLKRAHGPTTTY